MAPRIKPSKIQHETERKRREREERVYVTRKNMCYFQYGMETKDLCHRIHKDT